MKNSFFILLAMACAAYCVPGAQAVKCYACNYTNVVPWYMPTCDDPFEGNTDNTLVAECDGVCVKGSGRIYYDGGYVSGLTRDCRAGSTVEDCPNGCGSLGRQEGCEHCCDTDFCNSAHSPTFDLLAAAAALFLSLLLLAA